jgi:hypothetical protein
MCAAIVLDSAGLPCHGISFAHDQTLNGECATVPHEPVIIVTSRVKADEERRLEPSSSAAPLPERSDRHESD